MTQISASITLGLVWGLRFRHGPDTFDPYDGENGSSQQLVLVLHRVDTVRPVGKVTKASAAGHRPNPNAVAATNAGSKRAARAPRVSWTTPRALPLAYNDVTTEGAKG